MKHKIIYSLLFAGLGFAACKNGHDKEYAQDSTLGGDTLTEVQTEVQTRTEDSSLMFNNQTMAFQNDLTQHKIDWNRFNLKQYGTVVDSSQKWVSFDKNAAFYKTYSKVLNWSPDKKMILDLGSDNLVNDDNGDLEEGDPETQLTIINPENKQRRQLMYLGPSANILSAKWLTNTQVAILGTFPSKNPNVDDTILHIIDVQKNYVRDYTYNK